MLEVLIDNRDGNLWDISELVDTASWATSRTGKPGKLDLSFVKGGIYQNASFRVRNGDIVRVRKDGANVFYGYVFTVNWGMSESVRLVAYDQLRYLTANDTYVFQNATASDVIRRIANDTGLQLGTIADTQYRIPSQVEDGKKLIDIACTALDKTLIATGNIYVLYDDFGLLCLQDSKELRLDFLIGDGSLMTEYEFERSIDQDTYNRIKLVQDDKETKKRSVYLAQDSGNIALWGRLQYYEKVEDGMSAAQINELLNNLISIKNRETQKLRITALGDIRVRAGCFVPITIQEFDIQEYFLVDECTHRFNGEDYTMTLEMKVIR
jgi:hypothetical protein